ncbi:unnamed protein product [Albugo candida]|uniref:Uncharacterized protein n=1 Tax=Albugo candida TaxID=65357 RepID=A0A024GHT3_9STRA|nr:unnamed protein product [Albugo candida]|eukprot:CCI46335.1 unnamed protein product [Albugo candida]
MSGLTFVPCNTLDIIAQLRRTIHIFDCSCLNFLSIVFQQEDDLEKQNEELRQKKHHTEADSTEVLIHRSKSNFAPNDRLGIFFSRLYPVWLGRYVFLKVMIIFKRSAQRRTYIMSYARQHIRFAFGLLHFHHYEKYFPKRYFPSMAQKGSLFWISLHPFQCLEFNHID